VALAGGAGSMTLHILQDILQHKLLNLQVQKDVKDVMDVVLVFPSDSFDLMDVWFYVRVYYLENILHTLHIHLAECFQVSAEAGVRGSAPFSLPPAAACPITQVRWTLEDSPILCAVRDRAPTCASCPGLSAGKTQS
jgi:hypothetical protein